MIRYKQLPRVSTGRRRAACAAASWELSVWRVQSLFQTSEHEVACGVRSGGVGIICAAGVGPGFKVQMGWSCGMYWFTAFCEVIRVCWRRVCKIGVLLTGGRACEGASGLYDGSVFNGTLYIGC